MKKASKMVVLLIVVSLLLGAAAITHAQKGKKKEWQKSDQKSGMHQDMQLYSLVKKLDLTEEQLVKFLPAWNEQDDLRKSFRAEKGKVVLEIKELMKQEKVSDKELGKALDRIEVVNEKHRKAKEANSKKMQDVLTLQQKAKLVLYGNGKSRGFDKGQKGEGKKEKLQRREHMNDMPMHQED
ncbi:MAG: hypothetical protein ABH868_07280 [bacterium]